ncbi:hypothetical protein B7P43_G09302 [Cryptotermes secundus]|uniref:Uncharacterized protein n=1 Tax=Cryptotermes secundus TaxID=105785 RepID=A0A2J7Q0F3_9NEOP|nr:hypothetical protein B7P43_G09302 [Cryptotermes secundus]
MVQFHQAFLTAGVQNTGKLHPSKLKNTKTQMHNHTQNVNSILDTMCTVKHKDFRESEWLIR